MLKLVKANQINNLSDLQPIPNMFELQTAVAGLKHLAQNILK